MNRSHRSDGFTLIEVGIIVPILIVTILVLFDALFAMIRSSTVERAQIDMSYAKQIAIANIESDIILTSLFLPSPDPATLNDPYLPTSNGNTWSYLGDSSTSRVLLLKAYSTTTNPFNGNRQPVFIGDPASSGCNSTNIYFNNVQQYDIIYFVKNGNLYRRRLVDATTNYCDPGQYQKLSCPSAADLGTAQNASCKSNDELLVKNVTNFTVNYYGTKSSTTPLDVYSFGADPALVTTAVDAEVSLTITQKASGQSITSTSSLRMSKLNTKATSN